MEKTLIFIDLDDTLIATKQVKQAIFTMFEQLGYTRDLIEATYPQVYNTQGYHPADHAALLNQSHSSQEEEAFQIAWEQFQATLPAYLFPETFPFLQAINREKYSPHLLTWGNPDFQRIKAERSGVTPFFDAIHTMLNDKHKYLVEQTLVTPQTKFYLIDDKDSIREEMEARFPHVHTYAALPDPTIFS